MWVLVFRDHICWNPVGREQYDVPQLADAATNACKGGVRDNVVSSVIYGSETP